MDVALVPQNHLGRLPEELLLEIIKQPCLSVRDLISLARTNRRHYRVAISPAYKAHVERSHGLAIYWAIENERHATLERLVENGIDVNMDNTSHGEYLDRDELQIAMDDLKSTKAHMERAVNFEREVWATPLVWAASHGQDSTVKYLLDNGANLERGSFGLCECCHQLLHCSSYDDFPFPPRLEFMKDDYEHDYGEHDSWSALHYALCYEHVSTAKLLLARGANAHNLGGGVPALLVATYVGLNEIVDYLMENCAADINVKNHNGATALHVAHAARKYDLVDKYLERGADINVSYTEHSGPWTIFLMACAEGKFKRALKYLRKGANPQIVIQNQYHRVWDQYTALRYIWRPRMRGFGMEAGRLASALKLEQEIIAKGT